MRLLVGFLVLTQPLARLVGRLEAGLTPWRHRGTAGLASPLPRTRSLWRERWLDLDKRLRAIEAALKALGAPVIRGGDYERWDLEVRGGFFGAVRLLVAVEDHGGGAQLVRFRWWPRSSSAGIAIAALVAGLAGAATLAQAWIVAAILGALTVFCLLATALDCARAAAMISRALESSSAGET